ncbi:spermidine synthase [Hoyosella rhizosphaerae]|uniref:Spermidine synthase n=1 Tax=Hoyosella rhizosphaerae TaxID=1755582 RepID=A0A916U2S7_9ACTN|nr:spermidine synthase [Hoyosella rhizosphaerae]MBN4926577.1 spermidine synthase [Hoyosella rhizosphaerae]GGC58170.1 spermidine synthase [Hoyosella rhizosphaerae]
MRFEELGWGTTPMGEISLRRRFDPTFKCDVFEVKLDDDFLMSSLFTVAEEELALLALAKLEGENLSVAVGGLGLGYTAATVLADSRVESLIVIDALEHVISWHERQLIPAGDRLVEDLRCQFVHADFFELARSESLDPEIADAKFDAVIVDIDHSPSHVLHPSHASFYTPEGLQGMAKHLTPGGVFALWSNDAPDDQFTEMLGNAIGPASAHIVTFENRLQGKDSANTVYLANKV